MPIYLEESRNRLAPLSDYKTSNASEINSVHIAMVIVIGGIYMLAKSQKVRERLQTPVQRILFTSGCTGVLIASLIILFSGTEAETVARQCLTFSFSYLVRSYFACFFGWLGVMTLFLAFTYQRTIFPLQKWIRNGENDAPDSN
jgi:uncharacterized membrane protein YiaA